MGELIFADFPNKCHARQFVDQVKHRYALNGWVNYGLCDDQGEPLHDWVTIERPLSKKDRSKIEHEIDKLAEEFGGVWTGT